MQPIQTQGFTSMLRRRLRRPSTLVFLCAGLLAADPLRWLLATRTDATPRRIVLPLPVSKPLCDRSLSRPLPRRRKLMRNRILAFLLFVAVLVLLPAAVAAWLA